MRNRHVNGRVPDFAAPFCAGGRDVGPYDGAVEHLNQVGCLAGLSQDLKENASNTPVRLSRQNRFQILFQFPNSLGSARHVTLWTVK